MAADRGNDKIAYLYSWYYPAVLRAIKSIIEAGVKEGIMVGMCGEAAADPLLTPLLIAWGMEEFSTSAPSILRTRQDHLPVDGRGGQGARRQGGTSAPPPKRSRRCSEAAAK